MNMETIKHLPLNVQRGILKNNVEGASEGFPSNKKAREEKAARESLNIFDAAHPEVYAAEKAERAAKEAKAMEELRPKMHKI